MLWQEDDFSHEIEDKILPGIMTVAEIILRIIDHKFLDSMQAHSLDKKRFHIGTISTANGFRRKE
jgi:hypothetical protein